MLNTVDYNNKELIAGFNRAKAKVEISYNSGVLTLYDINEWSKYALNRMLKAEEENDIKSYAFNSGMLKGYQCGVALLNSRTEYATRNLTVFDI